MSAMGIRRSSTIWELVTLPPSWLPGMDSLSLTLRPVPKKKQKHCIFIKNMIHCIFLCSIFTCIFLLIALSKLDHLIPTIIGPYSANDLFCSIMKSSLHVMNSGISSLISHGNET